MMEYKPGRGYGGDGSKRHRIIWPPLTALVIALILYAIMFTGTAMLFGWWSIFVDGWILYFFHWLSKRMNRKIKNLDKLT